MMVKLKYFSFFFLFLLFSSICTTILIANEKSFYQYIFGQSATTGVDDSSSTISPNIIRSYESSSLFTDKPVSIANSSKGLILMNSWATWCIPCREEMPALEKLYNEFNSKGLNIIGINIDGPGAQEAVKSFVQKDKLTYTFWYDPDNNFAQVFRTMGVPESFLIDKSGKLLHQWRGQFDPLSPETKDIINTALAEQSSPSAVNSQKDIQFKGVSQVGLPIAFVAGVLSFFSPCILPIIPSFIAFITGMSSEELLRKNRKTKYSNKSNDGHHKNYDDTDFISLNSDNIKTSGTNEKLSVIKSKTFVRGCLFILGFSIVFVALGASITAVGSAFQLYNRWIEIIGGILIIIFGLNLMGILKIPGAQRDRGYKFSQRPAGHVGSLLIGMGFGAGWTPCIGPILASILTIAAITTSISQGIILLIVYSIGLAIPFIISALAIDKYIVTYKKINKWIPWIHRLSVSLLLIMGILLITGYLTIFTNYLINIFPVLG